MNKIFDRCPFCNKAAIKTETNEKRFEIYAFCSECDEILDITDYIPDWELHGYLEREYRVFIPRQRTKKDTKDEKDDEIDYNPFDEPLDNILDLDTWDEI